MDAGEEGSLPRSCSLLGAGQGPGAETDKVSSLSPAPPELLQEPQVPLLMPSLCLALAQHCLSNF